MEAAKSSWHWFCVFNEKKRFSLFWIILMILNTGQLFSLSFQFNRNVAKRSQLANFPNRTHLNINYILFRITQKKIKISSELLNEIKFRNFWGIRKFASLHSINPRRIWIRIKLQSNLSPRVCSSPEILGSWRKKCI